MFWTKAVTLNILMFKFLKISPSQANYMPLIDQRWFSHISRPSRYLGNEFNSVSKDPAHTEVSIALAFPDVYEVGMSHLGLKILYHILNSHQWLAAERVFSPWVDLEEELRRRKIPLATLESDRPLSSFDIIGFSLQHELSYTNVLNMLDLAGIPLFASERSEDAPLIIAGGPACFNPEPAADFFDAMVIGDGEAAAIEICRMVRDKKQRRIKDKKELLDQLRHIQGLYIPSFFRIHYGPEKTVAAIEALVQDYPYVEKAILPAIDDYPYPSRQVVPFTELVHDRLAIEISRGCTRGCRFCQAGMIYRPVRERSPASILENAETALKLTGYEDLSLLSLSSGDYSCIEPLLKALMDRQSRENIAISLPSLRVDSLNPSIIEQVKRVRKTGFTLAAEAGNDRLRRIINKGLTQEEILDMARFVYGAGWSLIKLYFMVGLPFEEEGDLQDTVDLARQVAGLAAKRGNKPKLNVSISSFVPKSHTPFMWSPQIPLEESRRRIQMIRNGLRGSRIRVKWNQPELSWLEGIFSRGDRRLSRTIVAAWKLGARFDAWGEQFHMEIWQEALKRSGLDAQYYLNRERPLEEVLPWDHIKSGVTRDFLKNEWERAQKGRSTPDCRGKCLECGVCDHNVVDPVLFRVSDFPSILESHSLKPLISQSSEKYRLTFTKQGNAGHLSHLELVQVFIRAFKRAGLDLVYSRGFHPMPKLSFACALPVGTESLQETLDIELAESSDISHLEACINGQLPPGIDVISVEKIPPGRKKAILKESAFIVTLNGRELKEEYLKRFLESDHFTVVKTTKKGEHRINAKHQVKSIRIISPNKIGLVLDQIEGPKLKPDEIVEGIFLLKGLTGYDIKTVKTKQVLA